MDCSKIEKIIRQKFSDINFNVDSLSRELNVSASHLRELICINYNMCPQKLIESIRLENAVELMANNEKTYTIAVKSGYSSTRTLRRAFKKRIGISLTTLKELLNNQQAEMEEVLNRIWQN